MSKANNKELRHNKVSRYWVVSNDIKILEKEKKTLSKELVSLLSKRNLKTEDYESGRKVTLVESNYLKLNTERLAKKLKISHDELLDLMEESKEEYPKAPHVRIT